MAYIYDLTDTWNAGGTTFNAIKMNVTNTASAAASKLVTLQTSGTEHFSVTKAGVGYFSGNLGVGTAAPSEAVEISRDANPKIRFLDVGNIDAKIGIVGSTALGFEVNGAERMRIDSSGNVGIGTTTPAEKFQVIGSIRVNTTSTIFSNTYSAGNTQTWLTNNASSGDTYFTTDSAQRYRMLTGIGHQWETAFSGTAGTSVSYIERMRLNLDGNLGINTTTPGYRLDVSGQARSFGTPSTFAQLQSLTQYTGSAAPVALGQGSDSTGFLINIANASLAFGTNNAERMRIDASGNLLVGTTSIGLSNTNSLVLDPGNGYLITNHSGTGSGTAYAFFGYNGTSIGTITQNGTTGVLYNTSSDIRLKENIDDADDAASLIDAIQVRKFDWKAGGSHQRYGFVAQELVTVAPEAVSQPEDPEEMMGVDYSKLVPMLVKEIQSMRLRLAQLEGN